MAEKFRVALSGDFRRPDGSPAYPDFDLSCSLGIPGQFDHPKFADAIRRVGDACRRHGKAAGRLVPDVQTGVRIHDEDGFDFVCYSGDVWALQAAVKAGIDAIRAGVEG